MIKKRIFKSSSILAVFAIVCLLLMLAACDKSNNISSISDLQNISTAIDNNNRYKLTKDLDMKETNWKPIEVFYGTLDGNGHTIKNLKLTNELANGLFNVLRGKVINLTIEVEIQGNYSGGIASKLENNGLIENCVVRGVIGTTTSKYVGGIVGTLINSTIRNCTNYATINGDETIGGIVGYAWNKFQDNIIEGSTNEGTINGKTQVGGIVGTIFGDAVVDFNNPDSLNDCYGYLRDNHNKGAISASGDNIGGIAGHVKGTESKKRQTTDDEYQYAYGYIDISNCENEGAISGNNNVGGIVGQAAQYLSQFTNCHNTGLIKANNYVGGIVGRNKAGIITNLTNDGKVSGNNYIGGIAGSSTAVTKSKNNGEVTASRYCGGIVGQIISTETTTECENHGAVTGTSTNIGGIVGYCTQAATLEKCNNYGLVTSSATSRVDGIIGYGPSVILIDCLDNSRN